MSFITLSGLNTAQEPEVQPDGSYSLICESAELKPSKKNASRSVMHMRIGFADIDNARSFMSWSSLPCEDDTPEMQDRFLLDVKRMLSAFGVDMDSEGFELEDLIGANAENVHVSMAANEETGQEYNEVKYWPKLRVEG